jgi:hypothetical protein
VSTRSGGRLTHEVETSKLLYPRSLQTHRLIPADLGVKGSRVPSRQPDEYASRHPT